MTGVTIANDAACGFEEHQHTEACTPEKTLICGYDSTAETTAEDTEPQQGEEPAHTHTDACYKMVERCQLEEHVHQISCYSDPDADVETAEVWENTLPKLTDNTGENMLLIAQSQLGYRESDRNYELAEDGLTKCGITRYGQWCGNPYGDWANMFTAFCMRYAGVSDDLIHSCAKVMLDCWKENGFYRDAGGYKPIAGDVVFLDKNQNGTVETTAVLVSADELIVTVIEGDVDGAVVQSTYSLEEGQVIGYGISAPKRQLMMFAAAPTASGTQIGNTANYTSTLLTQGGNFIVYTAADNGKHYALDGNGGAVEIQIDASGGIYTDVADPNTLYWTFEKANNYDNKPAFYIKNLATGKHMHPNRDSNTYGPIHPDRWESALYTSGSGVKIRGARQDAYVQLSGSEYTISNTQNGGSVMYFGKAPTAINLWLDGTNGNLMSCRGSDNTKHTVYSGVAYQLPSQWKSPTKYDYKLAGWVNIKTGDYYLPGANITITEDAVLYADWVARTYDIGEYNSFVADTLSTKDFITTKVFDYSSLINLLSSKVSVNVSGSSHSETWSHVASGTVSYKGQQTLDFSFNDHDGGGSLTNLNNLNNPNKYTGGTGVYAGIYNEELGEVLFSTDNLFDPETGEGIVGKHYLGEGDHLFQINTDPTSDYYGYYYYDAKLNAASYNQTDQRFYVYDYLARTSDSANNNDAGKYSDFLPLNSPYANTNGQTIKTYNYDGDNGEYSDVSHYVYDARYNSDGSATNQVMSNLWFGMRVDVQFGLPDVPGEKVSTGDYGNKDIYGKDMHFKFTGDDDVWILVDGKVVLDLGGIHQASEGDINFSTGEVRVNGSRVGSLSGIDSGEHTLSILYLERGSSMSNCAIYFNLAPRFSLTLEKEDVLTQEVLNGARFAIFNDLACTDPCKLWTSQQSYKNGDEPTNVFTIQKGQAYIWGFSPSRTYYIKEVSPPNAAGYEPAKGVIQLTLDKNGLNSYSATILDGVDENGNKVPVSHGFTVHGFRIDEENQAAYLVITNAQNWVTETTSIYVEKKWDDNEDHTHDAVTVYLNVTDPDGTVRRLREISLSEENDWKYTWTNLPKYALDPETMTESDIPIQYSVSEAYVPGYSPQIKELQSGVVTEEVWQESAAFKNGEVYVLKTDQGCLAAQAANKDTLHFVSEDEAKKSPLALWTATVSSGLVRLTNQAGQSLNFVRDSWCFTATTNGEKINLTSYAQGTGLALAATTRHNQWYTEVVYMSGTVNNGYLSGDGNSSAALILHPLVKQAGSSTVVIDGYGYFITNTPLETETSLQVKKRWDHPNGDEALYEKAQVTVRLLANGVDTGRTETISLKSNWAAIFNGLPYLDEDGNPIIYTIVETWDNEDWIPIYAPVTTIPGKDTPTYETTVTNTYRWSEECELPATGGTGTYVYILCGLVLILGPFVYGFRLRRRCERRSKQ
ncbi:MAG: Cna B-type domain-containing protein [Clostridia bacterium]|nr:Cna B-type domain-containing protein [Clostridia bacterium]